MKKTFNYLLILALATGLFVSCSDSDTKPKGHVEVEKPEVDYKEVSEAAAKAELKKIGETLATLDATEFAAQFAASTININTDEFTVFAIEDARNETPDETGADVRMMKSTNVKGASKINIHHHIIAGKPNFVNVTADKNYVYKTINGTEIVISKRNNVIYVNGVAMAKNEYYNTHKGQSHIYCVKDEVPEEKVSVSDIKGAYDIKVINVNTGNVSSPYTPSKDAYVMFFEKVGNDYRMVDKVRANDDGYATFFYDGNNEIYFKASNRGYNYIYKGFRVAGMYADNNAVANALPHEINGPMFQPKVGGIIFADIDGNGVINYNDKKGTKFLQLDKSSDQNTIYLAHPGM